MTDSTQQQPAVAGHGAPVSSLAADLVREASGVVLGSSEPIVVAIDAFLAGGHVLLEDVPGVGKTLLAKALARAIGGTFGRIQGTPDLLPSDLTGVSHLADDQRSWVFRPGPLFNHVVLVDEVNRATPRTQSALLEAMAEGHVTVDGTTHPLPQPFLVLATQNPQIDDPGTFPLVGGQRDRFAVSLSMGLPGRTAELELLAGRAGPRALDEVAAVAGPEVWLRARAEVRATYLHPVVAGYVLDIVEVVRTRSGARQPISPRAAVGLADLVRAHAAASGRNHVRPEDVQRLAVAALAHRVVDATHDSLPAARAHVDQLLRMVPAPVVPEQG